MELSCATATCLCTPSKVFSVFWKCRKEPGGEPWIDTKISGFTLRTHRDCLCSSKMYVFNNIENKTTVFHKLLLMANNFIRIRINYILKGSYHFVIIQFSMICCLIQVFFPFSKQFWTLNSTEINQNKMFKKSLELISMVVKIIWFEFRWYVKMQYDVMY